MEAAGEELVPAVDRCLLRLVHQDEFLRQTQAAGVVTLVLWPATNLPRLGIVL